MIIYKITNLINNKVYIGQTIRELNKRWAQHIKDSKRKSYPLYKSMRKYGTDNFKIETIFECENKEDMNFMEIEFIQYYRNTLGSNNIYNINNGGNGIGSMSNEVKIKISIKAMGNKYSQGIIPSEETRQKIRETKLGDKNPNYGKPRSEDSLNKLYNTNLEKSKLVLCIETNEIKPLLQWRKELNDNSGKIHRVCLGKRKHTRGLSFKYI